MSTDPSGHPILNPIQESPVNPPLSRYTEVLIGLLEHTSLSGQERAASVYLVGQMQQLGYSRAYVDESDSAVGVIDPADGADPAHTIVFLGHIDTVPGYVPVRVDGGSLYGRGSVDAKGPLATFVCGAALAGAIPGYRVVVVGATEEEATTSRGARHQLHVWQPDLVVIGEPSDWERMTLGYKGRVLLDLTIRRAITHTAGKAINAIEHAITFWNAAKAYIETYNQAHEKVFDQLLASIRHIETTADGLYETARLTLGFRLPVAVPPDALKAALTAILPRSDDLEVTLAYRGEEVAHRAEKNTPLVRLFNNAIRDQGGKPGFVYKTGTSDMNIVAPVWNVPILAYGPGDSTLDHTPNEHLELVDYHRAIQVVAGVIRGLGGR